MKQLFMTIEKETYHTRPYIKYKGFARIAWIYDLFHSFIIPKRNDRIGRNLALSKWGLGNVLQTVPDPDRMALEVDGCVATSCASVGPVHAGNAPG